MSARRYLIIIEGNGEGNYSAYSPDIPGVAATGSTQEDCEREMREVHEPQQAPGEAEAECQQSVETARQ